MKKEIPIYWVHDGRKYIGCAMHEGDCIKYVNKRNETFESLSADQLPEDMSLEEIWCDMVTEAEASEDGRFDVTNSPLI